MTRALGGGAASESLGDAERMEWMEETTGWRRGEAGQMKTEGNACLYFAFV